jgi:TPR repeat protein
MNPDLAIPACEEAVRRYPDSPRLAFQLGGAYNKNNDFKSALVQYLKAVDEGSAAAQTDAGVMYVDGKGVPQNDVEAVKWFRKAAENGAVRGQLSLGLTYQTGRGVPQNYVQAHMWYNVAASHFDASAEPIKSPDLEPIKLRDRLASVMNPAQIAEAQRLAQVCVQNKYKE